MLHLRWHRRIGLTIAFIVVFLAITGLLLNHSLGLTLNKKIIHTHWLMNWYGLETTDPTGYHLKNQWLVHNGTNSLFLNSQFIARCNAPLMGAVSTDAVSLLTDSSSHSPKENPLYLALCQDELLIFSSEGELIETLTTLTGLPEDTEKLQVVDSQVYLRSGAATLLLNIDSLELTPSKHYIDQWSQPSTPPTAIVTAVQASPDRPGITLETIILDLHSGRFFGDIGVWIIDFIGLLICLMAITGIWAWYQHYKLKKAEGG